MESGCKFIFNPEHDLCLASGDVNFIPPATAVRFAQEGKWIEKFMRAQGTVADSGPCSGCDSGSCSCSGKCAAQVVPWGWNAVLKRKLIGEGWPLEVLPSDEEIEFIRENSRREVAVELLESLQGVGLVSADYRIIARSLEEIESFLQNHNRVVLKAPLSGSGKGVRFVTGELMETDRGWCRKTIQKQGAVIVEQRMEIQQEFAMLFECAQTAERVTFRGYSMFYTSNGAYKGNILASDEYIENRLAKWVPEEILHKLQAEIALWLHEKFHGRYTGFVGVDMFICEDGLLNPAMEINLRMTMGLIARNIYDFHREEYSLGEGTHCFEPERGICEL